LIRRPVAALAALVAVLSLGACSGLGSTSNNSTATGGGVFTSIPEGKRAEPVAFTGKTWDGTTIDVTGYRGKVVVINLWGSWCGPCHREMPEIVAAEKKLQGKPVAFLGLNERDNAAGATGFERDYGMTWPSIADEGGRALLSFRGVLPPNSTPSTLILDARGRVAVRINGVVPSTLTLTELVEDTLA
jgi:thiol-disulfide isomerase/thioredoxin